MRVYPALMRVLHARQIRSAVVNPKHKLGRLLHANMPIACMLSKYKQTRNTETNTETKMAK